MTTEKGNEGDTCENPNKVPDIKVSKLGIEGAVLGIKMNERISEIVNGKSNGGMGAPCAQEIL